MFLDIRWPDIFGPRFDYAFVQREQRRQLRAAILGIDMRILPDVYPRNQELPGVFARDLAQGLLYIRVCAVVQV
jgi:hypothetical protein